MITILDKRWKMRNRFCISLDKYIAKALLISEIGDRSEIGERQISPSRDPGSEQVSGAMTRNPRYDILFEPVRIGPVTVRSTALRAVGDVQAPLGEHLLHIAEAQGASGRQPD